MKWLCPGCGQDQECKRVSTEPVTVDTWLSIGGKTWAVRGVQHRVRRWECKGCGQRFNTVEMVDEESVPRS